MIDFRYHLVSIVAVFLALAIGIVLGSTELQGSTIDGLRAVSDSLKTTLNDVTAQRDSAQQQVSADQQFLQTAEPRLLAGTLTGQSIVIITEPGAPGSVIGGVKQAAQSAGATVTGIVSLQPKFNDLSGATQSNLNGINGEMASETGTVLSQPADPQTANQQQAAQLIGTAILGKSSGDGTVPLSTALATTLLAAYAQNGYLSVSPTPIVPANLAVIVIPQNAPTDGTNDPGNEVLLAIAQSFATASDATVVVGSVSGSSPADSAISVLRSSSVSSQVSSVDNADTTLGQISTMWALADQLAGKKPNSYGISGASAVSPVPSAIASETPTTSSTPTNKATEGSKKP